MPTFEITTPTGTYEVDAPDEQTALDALQKSGEIKPASGLPADDSLSELRTMSGGMLEGIPVIGPMIRGGVERAAAGTLAAMSPDKEYAEVLKTIQQGTAEEKQANPGLDTGSQIAGAVAGTVPMVMAAPAAFGAGGGGLLARSGISAAAGTTLGGADAGVRSGGDLEAIKSGAKWGGAFGLGGPTLGQAVGAGTRALSSRFGGGAPQSAFGRAVGADGVDDIAGRLRDMGPDAMPMDIGPNLQRQAGALAATPGQSQQTIRSAVSQRQDRAGQRVASALDGALGQPLDTVALADDIIARRSAAAKPLYDAAYAKPVPYTRTIEHILTRPSVGKALKQAQRMAADEDIPSQQWFANIADDGTVTIKNVPDVRQLDLTKRALDDMIDGAKRSGNNNDARILTQLKDQLVKSVDAAVPEYAAARKAFAGPSAVMDALEEGQKAFSTTINPNQLRAQLMKMGASEREAFVQGARAQIANIMGTARNDALSARTTFMKGYNKEKLEILIGKERAAQMLKSLDAETAFTKTRDVVTGNSETVARASAQADVGAGPQRPGLLRSAFNMRFGDAAADLGDMAIGASKSASQSKANEELARLLTSRNPADLQRTVKLVMTAKNRGDLSAQKAKEIVNGLMIGASQKRRPLGITVTP